MAAASLAKRPFTEPSMTVSPARINAPPNKTFIQLRGETYLAGKFGA